jgi:hypothetical protein
LWIVDCPQDPADCVRRRQAKADLSIADCGLRIADCPQDQ